MTPDLRNHLLQKLVQAIFPIPNLLVMLLAEKIYKIHKVLKEKESGWPYRLELS